MIVVEGEFMIFELLDVCVLFLAEVTLILSEVLLQTQMRSWA